MDYISTRGNSSPAKSSEAIVQGMVPRGGLFVPEKIPEADIQNLRHLSYQDLCCAIMDPYLTGAFKDYTPEEIKEYAYSAYNTNKFDSDKIAPLFKLSDTTSILELWHGPTAAFKDLALQILPYFLTGGIRKLGRKKEVVILVATSGDTGKAALEGFKDVPGTRVIVFYPKNGVSKVQELQMLTTGGANTSVVGVKGNFDDCQTMVKDIFADSSYTTECSLRGFEFSSANSINWGRLLPQIVYYFWAYFEMVRQGSIEFGDSINACVPTGNFGNILAGFYAREMGLPIKTLICASNKNNVLTDFIRNGVYNRKREFFKTSSPSMDILISSNLERFLFEVTNHNPHKISRWYEELAKTGEFKIDESSRQRIKNTMVGDFATEEETFAEIARVYKDKNYVLDPHTAVASAVYEKYRKETGDSTPVFICGTASPFKFNLAVYSALTGSSDETDEFAVAEKLTGFGGLKTPRSLAGLEKLPVRFDRVIAVKEGRQAIRSILGI